ncbi:hypothetical protein JWG39_10805 [Desulforhopalus vacuolatus]|uniref:hypothetical protein n=1 Tax=Desulforhopalus vacuolatus TaxID=40414 RepID=UPI001965D475|nr:hypothetical protein [Desulforhopalus vacuolatus]MBM9520301.1 hypothetical protein [Desulforhopalus vacuolatus]
MYVCIDFDGTIVDHEYPEIGKPVPKAIDWLLRLQDRGALLILWTMRSDSEEASLLSNAVQYLEENGVVLSGINENPGQAEWTSSPKAYADVYVDDSAAGCPLIQPLGFKRPCVNWKKIGPIVDKMLYP